MKSVFWKMAGILAVAALFACTPEENNSTGTDEPGGGKNGTVHVTGISLDHPSATIKEGETITLVATVTPDNAANKTVKWSSSSETVATVDGNGKVTGIKAGSATITATTEDGGKKATCALTVEANLAPSITVGAEHISAISVVLKGKANLGTSSASDLKIGFQYSKSAGILPSNSTTVDAQDADSDYNYTTALTGLEPDTKYYFRSFVRQNGQDTYGETKEFTTKDLESLIGTNDATDVEAAKATLNAKLDLTDVRYSSISYGFYRGTSETTQNTKLNGGEIKGNTYSASLTNLSHKTQYWYKAYVKLDNQTFYGEVKTFTTDVVPVESVSLDKTEYTFNTIGNTLTLKASVLPADATDKSVSWSSDKEAVATVDANGRVNAKGNGTATITVTTKDQGKSATCVITVAQWVTGISLDKTSITLNEGQEQTLIPTVNPSNAADKSLNWTSSNTSVATVNAEGKVTAVSKGTATIKAEAKDGSGKYASCYIRIVERDASSTEKPSDPGAVYITHCEDVTGWEHVASLGLDMENHQEGKACLSASAPGQFVWIFNLENPVDCSSVTKEKGHLSFDIYVSNAAGMKLNDGNGQIEISSTTKDDDAEYNWDIKSLNLKDGWNHIDLSLSSASVSGGEPNMAAINHFRFYHVGWETDSPVAVKLDNIRMRNIAQ